MEYRPLGRTGIKVSKLTIGAQNFGVTGTTDHDEAARLLGAALDAGINTIDTADIYGESESVIGDYLSRSGRRDEVVLATKFGTKGLTADPNGKGGSRRWVLRCVERSLRRLNTDHIDLFQLHRFDKHTDFEETLSVLTDLVRAGKVLAVGVSTFPPELIVESQWVSEKRGLVRFRSEQPPYSIFARGVEGHLLPTCQRYGMGVLTWGSLNGGWLSGGYRAGRPFPAGSRAAKSGIDPADPGVLRKLDLVEKLADLAKSAGLTMVQLALGFVTEHPAVSSAIVGLRDRAQLDEALAAADIRLGPDVLERIDEIVAPGTYVDEGQGSAMSSNRGDSGFTAEPFRNPGQRRRPR
ncbi:aldo/keto reductase [Saccharothrix violaceirubra]|uniref:Aryl-alcohol dehydrogenase-like predicted oxidoreductase n=1 Tax=Saccharothrix violaceirubra TaxID=413306 RepID=A0A7W7WVW8_9PSEU|nr:aldo/keto reductase [Saccharothrix violaceirubra]MBB4965765.1 aryl-alcohol dehydrogenase-like predicted oxidoreductase [Saccharothrix violaceirubra]